MRAAIIKKSGPAEPRKRGSQPGVKRGNYRPRRVKAEEPQTPEQIALRDRICREYWGAEACDAGVMSLNCRTGKYQPVRTLLPQDHERQPAPAPGARVCRGCGAEMDLSEFSPNGRGGHKARCKECCAEAAREYASTEQGKAARALAQAKYRAAMEAQERRAKAREDWIERLKKTPAGRAALADLEARQADFEARQAAIRKDVKC